MQDLGLNDEILICTLKRGFGTMPRCDAAWRRFGLSPASLTVDDSAGLQFIHGPFTWTCDCGLTISLVCLSLFSI